MVKKTIEKLLLSFGYGLVRVSKERTYPVELSEQDVNVLKYVQENRLTMASSERLVSTLMACNYVQRSGIDGDFVECGVWRGGNSIVAADVFRRRGGLKKIWMFDTFSGMTAPTALDVSRNGEQAMHKYRSGSRETHNEWCYASLDDVRKQFMEASLLSDNVHFVEGDVSVTLKDVKNLPDRISVLRLDTDWYESTKLELEVLYPRLEPGGVLIVDDYGHWGGARRAVDEYFKNYASPFFQVIDYAGRAGVKVL